MRAFIQRIKREHLFIFFSIGLITSLVYSPFALSVAMFCIVGISVFHLGWRGDKVWVSFNPEWRALFKRVFENKAFLAVTLFFFLVLFSGLFSEDMDFWIRRVKTKLPFLMLPFAFAGVKPLSEKQYLGLYYYLVFLLLLTCIAIGINYALHFEEINLLLKKGQPMPTPRNHIRFSLTLALGIIAGGVLYKKGYYLKYVWERHLILGATLFLFFFIHLLSVRSGLAVLYAALIILSLRYVYITRRYWVGLGGIVLICLAPIIAFYTIPSFYAKIDYMIYDRWMRVHDQPAEQYSDAGRLASLSIGLEIGNAHPIVGVGIGDLKNEVYQKYALYYPAVSEPKMPHNQLVYVYAGTGIIGLLGFVFAFFYPIYYQKNYRDTIFLAFNIIVFISFMAENTIENSMGAGFYAFFLLLGLNHHLRWS